jgi:cytochrome P450
MLEFLRLLVRLQWPLRLLSPLFGRYHPYHPSYARDPYPAYSRLREEAPVYRHPLFRAWVLSRYDDIATTLKSPYASVNRTETTVPDFLNPMKGLSDEFLQVIQRALLMIDPPDHTRIRNLVNKAFTPRVVDAMRPRIQQVVDETIDTMLAGVAPGEPVDLVSEFAIPVPIRVIGEMLGVSPDDREQFKHWATQIGGLLDPVSAVPSLRDAEVAYLEMKSYFDDLFEQRRREPRDDLVSALVATRHEGSRLDPDELLATVALILGAGHETTTNLIANAVVALFRNPGERKRLEDDPRLIESAVDEFLRYDGPVQATDRILTEAIELRGQTIPAGSLVLLLLGSGNHDPAQFADPDRLDLSRAENHHLSFSQGPHFCLGAQLARAEAQIAITTLLRRLPDLRDLPEPLRWRRSIVLRGPLALPVLV